jgi:hypothetical protein
MMKANSKAFNQEELNTIVFTGTPKEEPYKPITKEDLHEALFYIQDLLERASLEFLVLGDPARSMIQENEFMKGNKVELAIRRTHYTLSGAAMFKDLLPKARYVGNKIFTEYSRVPIEITIVDTVYPFFLNPNVVSYYLTEFNLPNPFEEYWLVRKDIK